MLRPSGHSFCALLALLLRVGCTRGLGSPSDLVDAFEVQLRSGGTWTSVEAAPAANDAPPRGFEWATDWMLDRSGGCDAEGWTYAEVERTRRRRWLRVARPKEAVEAPADVVKVTREEKRLGAKIAHLSSRVATAVREDFTFRGFGLGLSHSTFEPRANTACHLHVPISRNFNSLERRSGYLPGVNFVLIAYPNNLWQVARGEAHTQVVVIISISYPVSVLRDGLRKLRPHRRGAASKSGVKFGSSSVHYVGFSMARSIGLSADGVSAIGPMRLRPWFFYAPGLRLLFDLLSRLLESALSRLEAANLGQEATNLELSDAEPSEVERKQNETTLLLNSTVNTTRAPKKKTPMKKRSVEVKRPTKARGRRRQAPWAIVSRKLASHTLQASARFKGWCRSKTSVLGYSFLPIDVMEFSGADRSNRPRSSLMMGSVYIRLSPFFFSKQKL